MPATLATTQALVLARCIPASTCPQVERCARRDQGLSDRACAIDATVLSLGKFCPLFVDVRGVRPQVPT